MDDCPTSVVKAVVRNYNHNSYRHYSSILQHRLVPLRTKYSNLSKRKEIQMINYYLTILYKFEEAGLIKQILYHFEIMTYYLRPTSLV